MPAPSNRGSNDRPAQRPRSGGKPPGKPGAKPGPRTGGKPGGRPSGKPTGKPGQRSGGKPGGRPSGKPTGKPSRRPAGRPRDGEPSSPRSSRSVGRDPRIPDEIHIEDLDPAVLNELRTLPEDLGEVVGRHLLAAQAALLEDDVDRATAHAESARRKAARVASVREAAGIVAYRAGDYAKALNEFRTVRRMTGGDEFVPIMADCERGLGRPERALDLLKELKRSTGEVRIEALLVGAGARADLGQIDAALVMLKIPELTGDGDLEVRIRLQYAYADLLEQAGRVDEARAWFARVAEADVADITDAAERLLPAEKGDL